jgi:4a-hydroxytetrahydrobiopterin dehydratase
MIDRKMSRSYKFYNFIESIQFVNRVAQAAEAINRHPDIYIRGNVVSLTLTPRDSDGMMLSDFQLAASLDDAADQING